MAAYLGVSEASVAQAIKEKRITPLPDGSLDLAACAAEWKANTHPGKRGPAPKKKLNRNSAPDEVMRAAEELGIDPDGALSYNEAATLLKNCQARLAELELGEKQKRLVDFEDVKKEAFKLARTTRDRLLAVPDRLSAEVAGMTDPYAIHAKMTAEIRVAIEEVLRVAE